MLGLSVMIAYYQRGGVLWVFFFVFTYCFYCLFERVECFMVVPLIAVFFILMVI